MSYHYMQPILAVIFWGSLILALSGATALTPASVLDDEEDGR